MIMKRNLISVLILALLVVNLVLTGIMMFSVVCTSRKTAALIDDISAAMSLDLTDATSTEEPTATVSIADTATYKFADQLTITLKSSGDGKDHYFVTSVSFSMNTKDDGYKTYGASVAAGEHDTMLKAAVYEVLSSCTIEDLRADNNAVASKEILKRIQSEYGSEFIYKVNFIDFLYQ